MSSYLNALTLMHRISALQNSFIVKLLIHSVCVTNINVANFNYYQKECSVIPLVYIFC